MCFIAPCGGFVFGAMLCFSGTITRASNKQAEHSEVINVESCFNATADEQSASQKYTQRYNNEICLYQQGFYDQAKLLFDQLHSHRPQDDLVTYNLAVTEKKLGNNLRASQLFFILHKTAKQSSLHWLLSHNIKGLTISYLKTKKTLSYNNTLQLCKF